MFCHKCGAKLVNGALFCSKCGTRVPEEIVREMGETASAFIEPAFAPTHPVIMKSASKPEPEPEPEPEPARAWYAQNGMPVIAYSSLARGFFGGRFQSFDEKAAKRVLDRPAQKGYLCEENMRRLRNAEELAKELHTTVSDIALRYIFGAKMNLFAVVSSLNPQRLA